MSDNDQDRFTPEFERPDERERQAGKPIDDQARYFALWEARRQQRAAERLRGGPSLNVYEQVREENRTRFRRY
jgi:hypothetical protein